MAASWPVLHQRFIRGLSVVDPRQMHRASQPHEGDPEFCLWAIIPRRCLRGQPAHRDSMQKRVRVISQGAAEQIRLQERALENRARAFVALQRAQSRDTAQNVCCRCTLKRTRMCEMHIDVHESEKGEVLLRGVGTLRYVFPPNASVQWQPDGLTTHTKKWLLGAGFLGAPPISLNECSHRPSSSGRGGRRQGLGRLLPHEHLLRGDADPPGAGQLNQQNKQTRNIQHNKHKHTLIQ